MPQGTEANLPAAQREELSASSPNAHINTLAVPGTTRQEFRPAPCGRRTLTDHASALNVLYAFDRPYNAGVSHLIIAKSPDWSFRSDHATALIAIVAAFALHGLPRRTLLFGLLALLICWSRIFVGTQPRGDSDGLVCWESLYVGRQRIHLIFGKHFFVGGHGAAGFSIHDAVTDLLLRHRGAASFGPLPASMP
jgi:hypothetical protein